MRDTPVHGRIHSSLSTLGGECGVLVGSGNQAAINSQVRPEEFAAHRLLILHILILPASGERDAQQTWRQC
jgi:hypothetical protein